MSNFEYPNFPLYEVTEQDVKRADALFALLVKAEADPRVTNPVEKAFISAVLPELLSAYPQGFEGGRLLDTVEQVYAAKRLGEAYYPLGYDLRTLEVAADRQARRLHGQDYAEHAATPEFWTKYVFPYVNHGELEWDMRQNLRSTITEGYFVPRILAHIFQDRWGNSPTIVDVGTSLGLGLKKWSLHDDFPFEPEQVLQAPRRGEPVSPHLPPDVSAQKIIDFLAKQKPAIGRAVGIDILPVQPYEMDLVYSATFPLGRALIDSAEAKEFTDIAQAEPRDVMFAKRNIDASDPESLRQVAEYLPSGKADIFIFSGILLQIPPSELEVFFRNFLPYCNEGALFFINEWANVNPGVPTGIEMMRRDYWHKGQFKTLIKDPAHLDEPPVEFARHLNRQCQQMYLSRAGRALLEKAL